MRKARFLLAVLLLKAGLTFAAADKAPAWLQQAAEAATPLHAIDADALVLLHERKVQVDRRGRLIIEERKAVRVLTHSGRSHAQISKIYNTDSEKVVRFRAWLLRPSAPTKEYGKKKVMDMALTDNDIYNEARIKIITASSDVSRAEQGVVFGGESRTEVRTVFSQFSWLFQDWLPTLTSRLAVTLPEGWQAQSATFNHPAIRPTVEANRRIWELRDLKEIAAEPASPPLSSLAPRVAVSLFPGPGSDAPLLSFGNWRDVSQFLSGLADPQAVPDGGIASKAQELTSQAQTQMEKIRAVGSYVQDVNYVSIQTGLGRGGGYRPNAASEVFAKSYGDCKDKTALARAMLQSVGIDSYSVAIFSGDPGYVQESWPSPHQFNHAIVAVQVDESVQSPAIIEHSKFGRLLFFDPTDDETPVGRLPRSHEDSLVLVAAGDEGELVRVPTTTPEANRLERRIEAVLATDGSVKATIVEESQGAAAVAESRAFKIRSTAEYREFIQEWVAQGITGASVEQIQAAPEAGGFRLKVDFAAETYGKSMQRLLIFKPALVARRRSLALIEDHREHPVTLQSTAFAETARIQIPDGFAVDEMPDPIEMQEEFGSYVLRCRQEEGHLLMERSLTLKRSTVAPESYSQVRGFFLRIRDAEQTPVVLIRE